MSSFHSPKNYQLCNKKSESDASAEFLLYVFYLDPSVKRGVLHEPFGPKGITKKPRRTQRVRLRFFATFCLQSIRTEILRLTYGSRFYST